jgi:hypothetical protein
MITFAAEKIASRPFESIQTPRPVPCGNGQPCPPAHPAHEEIARCAYDIYVAHDRAEGRDELNWLQAEEELAQTPRTVRPKPEAHFRS